MKKANFKNIFLILTGIVFLTGKTGYSQSAAKIENIRFDAEGSKLVIYYDITKYKEGETFEIWVKIMTASGKTIIPSSVIGDVNKGVSGGTGKRIVWDAEADNALIEEEFSVEVYGRSESRKDGTVPKDTQKETGKPVEVKAEKSGISVPGAMAFSLLLPGLGNRIAKGQGAQWLLGIAGYACIAGSVVMNNAAYNSYEDYKIAQTAAERDDLYTQSQTQYNASRLFAGLAFGIWVGDLIWTGIQAGKFRKQSAKPAVSFHYFYNPDLNIPMAGIRYRF
ncbi:MAG: hypothetical protein FJY07_04350 [Bacteroidetes bacterium]|nr:hypothetical protein [Bacteroidota bacterium]